MNPKVNKFIVHFWLAVTIASLIYAFYAVYSQGWELGGKNFVIPVLAFMWYWMRKRMSARLEKSYENREK
ncbi:MAG: hypothetical protein RLZZ77_248 [Bacteroidota bacterium]|jgi:hypothetical protein